MTREALWIAKRERRNGSIPEALLWEFLRGRRLSGHKFRRQHPIGAFVVDFACVRAHLAVEIDGESHRVASRRRLDRRRDCNLRKLGWKILRIPANLVLRDPAAAAAIIAMHEAIVSLGSASLSEPLR